MKEEFDIVLPKTWLQLSLRPRCVAFTQAGIIIFIALPIIWH